MASSDRIQPEDKNKKWTESLSPEKLKRIRRANAARQAERRKKRDLLYKANRRANETPEEKAARLAKNAFYKTMCRRNETPEATAQRRQRDLVYKMRRRQKESLDQANARLMANARCQSARRGRDPSEAIAHTSCMHCASSESPTVDISEVRFSDNDQIFTLGDCYAIITGIKTESEANAICQMCQDQLIMSYKFKRQFQHFQPQKQECDGPTFQTIILQDFQPDPPTTALPSTFPPVIKLLPPIVRETMSETVPNQCGICLKTFTNPHGVQTHMDTIHSATARKYVCNHCGYETIHKKYIRIHVMRHVSGFVCVVCNKAFRNRHLMKNHQQQKHVVSNAGVTELSAEQLGIKVQCPVCGVMVNERRLVPHLESHSDKLIACSLCPKTFNTQINFDKHMAKVHSKTFKLRCEICGNGYDKQCKLDLHVTTHAGDQAGKHQCQHCQAAFKFSTGLLHHIKKIHPETCFTCPVPKCNEVLASQKSLDQHGNIHAALAAECLVCREKFENYFALYDHYEMHHRRTRKFYLKNLRDNCKCECGSVFSTMNILKYHIVQKAVGTKQTICRHCDKRCRTGEELAEHLVGHGGEYEAPYRCEGTIFCDFVTNEKEIFIQHLQAHSVVFQAEHHGAIAAEKLLLNLKKHEAIVRDGLVGSDPATTREYNCQDCPKKYRFRSSLYQHRQTAHRLPTEEIGVE